jgi:hypothetical protein
MRAVWFGMLLAASGLAQGLHFGIKAGVPLTTYFETGSAASLHGYADYSAATRRYTVGLSVEWRITPRFGFESGVLYKRTGYVAIVNSFSNGISITSALDSKGNSWDFPLLAKFRFARRPRPFISAGGSLRYIGPIRAKGQVTVEDLIAGTKITRPVDTTDLSDLRKRFYPGLAAGAGVELGGRRVHLQPEFRYTRWTANIAGPGGLLRFNPNQAEVLLGLLF